MDRTWRLYAPAGAWGLPSSSPRGIHAATLLQVLHSEEWELVQAQTTTTDVFLTKTDDRFTPAVATRLPSTALGDPDGHLSPQDRATAFAYVALAQAELSVLVDHTMFSLERNWWLVTKRHLATTDPGFGRLWRLDQARTQAQCRLQGAIVVDNALQRLVQGADGTPVWGLAGGPVEKDDAETLRRKAEGPLAEIEGDKAERKRGMKRTFELIKFNELATSILDPFSRLLRTSSTGFFLSSATPASLDLAVFSHLSLLIFPPWPQPLAGELLRARFPDLVTHTCLVRDLLWSPHRQGTRGVPLPPIIPSPPRNALVATAESLIPSWPPDWFRLPWSDPTPKDAKEDAVSPEQQRAFLTNRWIFVVGVTAFGLSAGWGTGMFRPSDSEERAEGSE